METEKKAASFDVASLAAVSEAEMEVTTPNGERTGWVWTFAGPGHPATIAADRREQQRSSERELEKERAQVNGRKWKGTVESPEQRKADAIEYIVARLLRWSEVSMAGEPFPFTSDNARRFLADPNFVHIWTQANTFLLEEKSFTKRSAKNLPLTPSAISN